MYRRALFSLPSTFVTAAVTTSRLRYETQRKGSFLDWGASLRYHPPRTSSLRAVANSLEGRPVAHRAQVATLHALPAALDNVRHARLCARVRSVDTQPFLHRRVVRDAAVAMPRARPVVASKDALEFKVADGAGGRVERARTATDGCHRLCVLSPARSHEERPRRPHDISLGGIAKAG